MIPQSANELIARETDRGKGIYSPLVLNIWIMHLEYLTSSRGYEMDDKVYVPKSEGGWDFITTDVQDYNRAKEV